MQNQIEKYERKFAKYIEDNKITKWLTEISFPISQNYNAMYGTSTVFSLLFKSIMSKANIADVANNNKDNGMPTGEWVRTLFIKMVNECDPAAMFDRVVKEQIRILKRKGRWPSVQDIAIDIHKDLRFDKTESDYLHHGKIDKKTCQYQKHITAQITINGSSIVFAIFSMSDEDTNVDCIRKILGKAKKFGINPGTFTLDKEFCITEVIDLFNRRHLTYLMPCKESIPVKKCIREFGKGKYKRVSKRTMKNRKKGLAAEYSMIIEESTRTESGYIAFATNNARINIDKYKKRWIIETGYRSVDRFKLKTSSRDHRVRKLMYILSSAIYNGWIIARNPRKKNDMFYVNGRQISQYGFKKKLEQFVNKFMEMWPPPNIHLEEEAHLR